MLRLAALGGPAAVTGLALVLSACGNSGVTTLSAPPTTNPSLTLTLQHSPQGPILATGGGNTLYDFVPDTPRRSACLNDGCVLQWPPLLKAGPVTVGRGIDSSLVSTLRRPGGTVQLSYGGHPLYTYNLDVTPGMVTGQAIDQDGGVLVCAQRQGSADHDGVLRDEPQRQRLSCTGCAPYAHFCYSSGEHVFEVLHGGSDVGSERGERLLHLGVVKVLSRSACRVEPTAFRPCRKLGFSRARDQACNPASAIGRREDVSPVKATGGHSSFLRVSSWSDASTAAMVAALQGATPIVTYCGVIRSDSKTDAGTLVADPQQCNRRRPVVHPWREKFRRTPRAWFQYVGHGRAGRRSRCCEEHPAQAGSAWRHGTPLARRSGRS